LEDKNLNLNQHQHQHRRTAMQVEVKIAKNVQRAAIALLTTMTQLFLVAEPQIRKLQGRQARQIVSATEDLASMA
jgi:hypothetical protein